MEASGLAHAEAQFIAKRIAMLAVADGRNLLLEVSLAARPSTDSWMSALRASGYTIAGVFAEISIEESVRRAEAAHRRGQQELLGGRGYGGQYIPADAIRALADTSAVGHAGPARAPWYPGSGDAGRLIRDYQAGVLTLHDLASAFHNAIWAAVPRD